VQRNWKIFSGGCITVALAFAGVYLTGLYGKVTLKYTRWTLNNDFRDGCINDLDHNLTLAEECFAELARPRVSAVNMKRQLGAVQDAVIANGLYWAVAMYIPVLTCVVYLVWMRMFVRDGPRPVTSLVKMDFSSCGVHRLAQEDYVFPELSHVRDHKVDDHLHQTLMDAPLSDLELDEDYFQTWKDKMEGRRADVGAGDSEIGIVRPCSPASSLRPQNDIANAFEKIVGLDLDSELGNIPGSHGIVAQDNTGSIVRHTFNIETSRSESFEVEFHPSGNRVKCQLIEVDGLISDVRPTDGVQLDLHRYSTQDAVSLLKFPFERGATAVSLVSQPPNQKAMDESSPQSWILYFTKRIMWARRLGLPTHRYVYLVVRDEPPRPPQWNSDA
jgi:hypothetical protein